MEVIFRPEQFTATQFDSVEEKARMANRLIDFLTKRRCARTAFTVKLYHAISLHLWGHIAHFDIHGFYATWFSSPEQVVSFIDQATIKRHNWIGCGDPKYTWSDVENVLTAYFVDHPEIKASYAREHARAVEAYERAQLARLQAKYGA